MTGLPNEPIAPSQASARAATVLRVVAVGVLVIAGVSLAALAIRSVFRSAATEVSIETSVPASRVGVQTGAPAPVFEVPGYDGRPLRLAAFRGHPIVLNFWTSWCPPCRAEAPTLEAVYLSYMSRGVVFIGVDLQNDTWADSRAFLTQHKITYPQGRDETGKVGRTYHVVEIPTTYFIKPDGTVAGPPLSGGFLGGKGARDLVVEIERLLQQP
jgi:cytochrome c biogenesis protein CcmG, thiol:disulfide interchange protein DsbE